MGFLKIVRDTVVLRHAATATLHWQSQRLESFVEHPSRCIDCRCILEWGFGLCQYPLEHVGFLCQTQCYILSAFGDIALLASESKITYSVSPTFAARMD